LGYYHRLFGNKVFGWKYNRMTENGTSLARVKVIAEVAGITTAVIALGALAITLLQIKQNIDAEQLRNWQEVVVFSIVEDAGAAGIKFDAIHDAYLKKERLLEDFNVPKSEIQVAALKRIAIRLMSKRAVIMTDDGSYKTLREPLFAADSRGRRIVAMQPIIDQVLSYIAKNEGKYTIDEVRREFQDRLKFTNVEYDSFMAELKAFNVIVVSEDGKVHIGLNGPPNP